MVDLKKGRKKIRKINENPLSPRETLDPPLNIKYYVIYQVFLTYFVIVLEVETQLKLFSFQVFRWCSLHIMSNGASITSKGGQLRKYLKKRDFYEEKALVRKGVANFLKQSETNLFCYQYLLNEKMFNSCFHIYF